ncbi:HsdR family type I site-specific deoxyribonuclease [Salinimicrobium sp. MT39]|uniref:Type I restriction enzyme endonuclease subunit n=1 Tax=Salinimicrobium profundisediminis TaxID=2994553 RepID=A0A9X3CVA4_9FLAO|nr:HsdR family type I site-specific deoxyribonuclease [Salinimicrobium profundisediminis]MCX2837265.1 HsdR family type I site-specific deoxyribonuclease [Salinimicrobium profundisediminis]
MKFTEEKLEQAIITHLEEEMYTYVSGKTILREESEVLLKGDLSEFLFSQYRDYGITQNEVESVIRKLETYPASDLYESNKAISRLISDGFLLKREDRNKKDLYIQLIDYSRSDKNIYKIVNQLEIVGYHKRIPDGIIYVNGIPLVVFEFKTAIQENTTVYNAFTQLTIRYRRDIPELFKYNAFCIISDGVNTRAGSFFAGYEYFYSWRKIEPEDKREVDGINSLYTMVKGMLNRDRLRDVVHNFIYLPDSSKKDEKIVCRYPQYYAARKLFDKIKEHQKPEGDGKGGTYFGATGCGKSFTMLFLTRLLMKSVYFSSPTIILITDRTDLDDQLSEQFTSAKLYVGDNEIKSVESRDKLKELLKGRNSGGVFLTTIHKFTEDTDLLTERTNVICISDEAHRSQINLDQKIKITKDGVKKTYGFAKYLHDSLPNATYVGFTGTPVDATLDVFGDVVDSYTMTESEKDGITKKIIYEGRAAKVILDNRKLEEIEEYYARVAEDGANEYQVEESKKQMANMNAILGDPHRLKAIAEDFVYHYEKRVAEGATVKGKAMFVASSRPIAYHLYKEITELRPNWAEERKHEPGAELTDKDKRELKPTKMIEMVMTRGKDDHQEMYEALGTKEDRKELDRQFKNEKSNFKIAIVVDMWLTGFDVPFLDSIYIDKPLQKHNLIQTISRVNRNYKGKEKGLVVDYIGIKKQMNLALKQYSAIDRDKFEDIDQSIIVVKDNLNLLSKIFYRFDSRGYFMGTSAEQLECLNQAVEFVQLTQDLERRFINIVKRLKAAYDICCASDEFGTKERDEIHFYLAIKSIVHKLTRADAPDTAQMNTKVREMIQEALDSDGVEEIYAMGEKDQVNIFDEDYLAKVEKIKLPNTRIKLLQKLLKKAIDDFGKVNKAQGVDFSNKFKTLVDRYNERKEDDVLRSEVLDEFTDEILALYNALREEQQSYKGLDIDFEEKAFYDILKSLAHKYDFKYPEAKLITLSKAVKDVVDDLTKYTDWSKRADIKAELKVDLIMLLAEHDYPPVDRDEVYQEIFEQAENFKKQRSF